MTPYTSYRLYQIERPKSTAEIRYADVQAGLFAATIADLLHAVARPVANTSHLAANIHIYLARWRRGGTGKAGRSSPSPARLREAQPSTTYN